MREVLRHKTVNKAMMVDIDEKVVECAGKYLPTFHNGSMEGSMTIILFAFGWEIAFWVVIQITWRCG